MAVMLQAVTAAGCCHHWFPTRAARPPDVLSVLATSVTMTDARSVKEWKPLSTLERRAYSRVVWGAQVNSAAVSVTTSDKALYATRIMAAPQDPTT